jgi:hypothetical protein
MDAPSISKVRPPFSEITYNQGTGALVCAMWITRGRIVLVRLRSSYEERQERRESYFRSSVPSIGIYICTYRGIVCFSAIQPPRVKELDNDFVDGFAKQVMWRFLVVIVSCL